MKTEVIMKRELFDETISQSSKTGFFSATDLATSGNKWRASKGLSYFKLNEFLRNKKTKEFMEFLSNEYGVIKINSKGRNSHTWVHPYLFIDIALAINPKLKVVVYKWIFDELIKYRNNSGDSYKKLTGSIVLMLSNKSNFKKEISKVAKRIKKECDVDDWQNANEEQLKLRDKIHEYFCLLSDVIKDVDNCLSVSIKKATDSIQDINEYINSN